MNKTELEAALTWLRTFNNNHSNTILARLLELEGETIRIEELENKLRQINNWIKAYPLKMFPEPDFKKVKEALKSNGLSLDEVGASYMRYVQRKRKVLINDPVRTTKRR